MRAPIYSSYDYVAEMRNGSLRSATLEVARAEMRVADAITDWRYSSPERRPHHRRILRIRIEALRDRRKHEAFYREWHDRLLNRLLIEAAGVPVAMERAA